VCGGEGCEECESGSFWLSECPSKYIGPEMIDDLQVIAATQDIMPTAGGLLDQSAWWFELRQELKRQENIIEEERDRRRRRVK
jgi:hypothetical protein